MQKEQKFLVYSCSGCSSAAQMANALALRLDREYLAEMSCIAGVGGDVPALLQIARSGRPVLAIDGCALECAHSCLRRHDISIQRHIVLSQHGVKKRKKTDFDSVQAEQIFATLKFELQSEA